MKSIVIKRIGVGQFAKYAGVAHAILGIVYAVFAVFAAVPAIVLHDNLSTIAIIGASVGSAVAILVFVPLLAYAIGWIYGAIVAFVLNIFLSASRGIELDIEEEK